MLHVVTGLGVGGAEESLVKLVTAGNNKTHPVTVVILSNENQFPNRARLDAAGVRVINLGMKLGSGRATALWRLTQIIRKFRPSVVQGWMYHADLISLFALLLSGRRRQTRLLWSVRCSELDLSCYRPTLGVVIRLWARMARFADGIVVNSDAGVAAHRMLGAKPRRIFRVDNGVDTERFRPDPDARETQRRTLGIAEDRFVIAIAGRVDPMKDHPLFLRVFDRLHQVCAVAVGLGTDALEDRPNFIRLGLRNDIQNIFAACDLLVSTSRFGEGFPNVIAEAMSSGLPVVATNVGDSARIVGDAGVVVAPGDEETMVSVIQAFASDPDRVRALGRTARERVCEKFSLQQMIDGFWGAHKGEEASSVGPESNDLCAGHRLHR